MESTLCSDPDIDYSTMHGNAYSLDLTNLDAEDKIELTFAVERKRLYALVKAFAIQNVSGLT